MNLQINIACEEKILSFAYSDNQYEVTLTRGFGIGPWEIMEYSKYVDHGDKYVGGEDFMEYHPDSGFEAMDWDSDEVKIIHADCKKMLKDFCNSK